MHGANFCNQFQLREKRRKAREERQKRRRLKSVKQVASHWDSNIDHPFWQSQPTAKWISVLWELINRLNRQWPRVLLLDASNLYHLISTKKESYRYVQVYNCALPDKSTYAKNMCYLSFGLVLSIIWSALEYWVQHTVVRQRNADVTVTHEFISRLTWSISWQFTIWGALMSSH